MILGMTLKGQIKVTILSTAYILETVHVRHMVTGTHIHEGMLLLLIFDIMMTFKGKIKATCLSIKWLKPKLLCQDQKLTIGRTERGSRFKPA